MFEEKIRLKTTDMDKFDRITYAAILNIFQDVAGSHATKLKAGYYELSARNIAWVLLRTKFEIIREPKFFETIVAKTWPNDGRRVEFGRDYLIEDEQGNPLVKGTSKWCLIDYIKRRPLRASVIEIIGEDNYLFGPDFPKLDVSLDDFVFYRKFEIPFLSLDHNNHMNNAYYANFICEFLLDKRYKYFEINYLKEVTYKEELSIYTKEIDDILYLIGKNKGEVNFIALLR